ncbi:eukaryotic and archaeal DNA primase, large subunit-domain-containing protein [Phlyctochytrium arcticum]|nr:eukaryotic and archaeal DNA primase, large subunit-domain-containing protein [Phlyctochytrium arcticum]
MFKQETTVAGGFSSVKGGSYEVSQHYDPKLGPYPSSLNFYLEPPPYELTLTEFETFSLDRLRVLKAIETAQIRAGPDGDLTKYVDPVLKEHLPLGRNAVITAVGAERLYQERRKDHISHFLLRLAYCRTQDLRRWFISQETRLFLYRFNQEEQKERNRFLRATKLEMDVISANDKERIAPQLRLTHNLNAEELASTNFYRVPFEKVINLVARRQVYLEAGFAYVPEREQATLVVDAFSTHLAAQLEITAKAVPQLDEDDRLMPVLNSISKQYLSKQYSPGEHRDRVTHQDIDTLSKHFPPCMRNLHNVLRQEGHLKHMARLEYGLFLKGVGLPLDEALIFWRRAFFKMTDDQFTKGYAYNVRYNYGMEGKRQNYSPYSCIRIITSNQPGPGEHHGCPFRHFSQDNLRALMHRYGVAESGMVDITRMAKEGHYQVACTRLFEATRGTHKRGGGGRNGDAAGGEVKSETQTQEPGEDTLMEIDR